MDIWEPGEVENLIGMLLSADDRNILLALELMKNRDNIDIEPFIEVLSLIKMAEDDYKISSAVAFLLDKGVNLEKYKEAQIVYNLFQTNWKKNNKKSFLKALNTYEKSRLIYEEYMIIKPSYVSIYNSLIYRLKKSKEQNLCLKYMKRVVEIEPNNAFGHFEYAYALSEIPSSIDEVIHHYEECIKLGMTDKAVKHNLACQYNQKKGNYKRAIVLLEENLIVYPEFVESMLELSNAYKSAGNKARAEELLLESIDVNPYYDSGYNNLSYFYWAELGNFEQALVYINKAIEIEGEKGLYWHTLAEVEWYGFKNKEKALSALHKAMEVDSSYTAAFAMIDEIENA